MALSVEVGNGDSYINSSELVDGKVTVKIDFNGVNVKVNQTLYLKSGNTILVDEYMTQADIDRGYYQKTIDVSSVMQDGKLNLTANAEDNVSSETTKMFTIDTSDLTTGLEIAIENGDGYVTQNEIKDGDIDVKVTLPNGVQAGDKITLVSNNETKNITITDSDVTNGKVDVSFVPLDNGETFKVKGTITDIAGNKGENSAKATMTLAPESSNDTISATEDIRYTLSMSDFGTYGENIASTDGIEVRIDSLPANGKLLYDGNVVKAGDVISASDVESGKLTFKSAENSDNDGSFKFSLADNGEWSENSYTTTIAVEAVADKPTVNIETITHDSIKTGEGLTFTTYNNVLFQNLHPDDYVRNSNILESFADHYAEAYSGNTKTVSEIAPNSSLEAETMVGAKGYIYLEAGQQVTFSGTIDDSAMIKLGGEVVLYTTGDAYGSVNTQSAGTSSVGGGEAVSAGTFTVSQSGYYSLETYVLNTGGPGNYNIQMSVDGGATYQDINTKNFDIYATQADVTKYAKNAGQYNTDIKLSGIDASLVDTDKSESLSISVEGIPVGATLSDGTNTFTVTSTNTIVDVKGWDLSSLTLNSPTAGTYTLNVIATTTETSNGDTASKSQALTVSVTNFPIDNEAQFIPEKCGCERDLQNDVITGNANDYLVVGDDIGSSHTEASRNVQVSMNGGNDVIELDGAIDWYAKVDMGDGDDVIRSGAGSIKGDSTVDMGNGNDTITTQGGFYDRTEVNMGNGDDTIYARCNIDYDAKVDMGDGNDTVTLGGGMYANGALTLGAGNDTVNMVASMNHQSSIDAGSGDDVLNVTSGSIRHNTKVDMGDGNDTINVSCHIGNNANIDLGNGNDTMSVSGSLWNKSSIDMGSGNDSFTLKGGAYGESNVDLGDGDDTLTLSAPGSNIDLTNVAAHYDNVETLNIKSTDSTKITLSVSDIIDSTDSNNVLTIQGDSNDSIVGDKQWSWKSWSYENSDSWTYAGVENGYNKYVGTDSVGHTATLLVEDTITTDL